MVAPMNEMNEGVDYVCFGEMSSGLIKKAASNDADVTDVRWYRFGRL